MEVTKVGLYWPAARLSAYYETTLGRGIHVKEDSSG